MSGPIQISVYPDKLLIWNPGELPPSWTVRNLLRKHASVPFNPAIARTFFRAGMIEAWGQGIERIRDAAREAGTPEPELNAEPNGLWVEFRYLPEHVAATGEALEVTPVETLGEGQTPVETSVDISREDWTPVETPVEISGEGRTPVETPVKTPAAIMALLRENPRLTLAEVAEKLGRSRRAVERETARLVSGGHLRFIGARKSGHWEVAPKMTPITGEMTPESRTTTLEMTPEMGETTPENRGATLEDRSRAGSSTGEVTGEVTGEERGIAPETPATTQETRRTTQETTPKTGVTTQETRQTTQEMTPENRATTLETQETTQETTSLPSSAGSST